jgi:forkhead protein FKH
MNGATSFSHATPDRSRPFAIGPPSSTPGPVPSRTATASASFEQPTPLSNKTGLKHSSAYSPPEPTPSQNSSATLYNPPPTSAAGGPEVTPFISRQHPRLAPPSAAVPPSQFMVMSSPAPFWKYADLGSTPARGQTGVGLSSDGVKVEDDDEAPAVEQPSSPPVLRRGGGDGDDEPDGDETVGEGSPSRTVSRPGSRAAGVGLGSGAHNINGRSPGLGGRGLGLGGLGGGYSVAKSKPEESFAEEEDDGEGIDLSKYATPLIHSTGCSTPSWSTPTCLEH